MATRRAKGEGCFINNKDGSVTFRKQVGYKADGNRKICTVTAKNRTACLKEMKIKEQEWQALKESRSINDTTTVGQLCYLHLQSQMEGDELKGKSIDRRECTIENHINGFALGHLQARMVVAADIEKHINMLISEKKLSASSVVKVIDVLNAAYNWGLRRKEVLDNPVYAIKPQLQKKIQKMEQKNAFDADVIVLSTEEKNRFITEALKVDEKGKQIYDKGLYCLFLLYTGMRCGEMLALRWKDYDKERGLLVIEKSSSITKNRG